jgi:hypothetical protein
MFFTVQHTNTKLQAPSGILFVFSYSLYFIIICFFVWIVLAFAFCPYCTSHTNTNIQLGEGDHLKNQGIDEWIILRWIFKRWDGGHGLDGYGSG